MCMYFSQLSGLLSPLCWNSFKLTPFFSAVEFKDEQHALALNLERHNEHMNSPSMNLLRARLRKNIYVTNNYINFSEGFQFLHNEQYNMRIPHTSCVVNVYFRIVS